MRVFFQSRRSLAKRGLAMVLGFLLAWNVDAARELYRAAAENSSPTSDLRLSTSANSLPNSCEVLAAQANARLERAGLWSRILIIRYGDKNEGRALCVYQPHWQIVVYDDTGSVELETNSRGPKHNRPLSRRPERPPDRKRPLPKIKLSS